MPSTSGGGAYISRSRSHFGSVSSASVTFHGRGGTQSCTAGVKGDVMMSFSISSTSYERKGYE